MVQRDGDIVTNSVAERNARESAAPAGWRAPDRLEVVAHELRTPLSVLRIAVDMLATKPGAQGGEISALLTRIRRSLHRVEALVDTLSVVTALGPDHRDARPDRADVRRGLDDAIALIEPLLARRGQRLEVTVPDAIPLAAVDPLALAQMLTNLLTNAAKYGPADDVIRVRIDLPSESIRISVSDRGPGVPVADRERIFQPYARGEAGLAAPGLGLGLYLVRALALAHGGAAGLSNGPAEGATFWIAIPALPPGSA